MQRRLVAFFRKYIQHASLFTPYTGILTGVWCKTREISGHLLGSTVQSACRVQESSLAMFSTEEVQAARVSRHTGHITCMQALAVQDGHLVITGSEDKTLRCGTNDPAV